MAESLQDLANRNPLGKAARLKAALPEIEAALAAGATHKEVLAALNERGFNLSFTVYQTTLARIRKPKKDKHAPAPPAPAKEKPAAETKTNSSKQPFAFHKTPAKDIWK